MQNKITHKSLMYALLASLGFALAGCEKLDQQANVPVIEAIPAEFGELVNVTPDQRYTAVLWFVQPDKTIVAVRVNLAREQISAKTVKFNRS
jgi:hypothetical protein